MTKFLLATCDTVWPARVRDVLGDAGKGHLLVLSGPGLDDAGELLRELRDTDSPVLVLGPGIGRQAALALVQAIGEHRQDVSVILVAEPSPVLLQEALRVGARDVVDPKASEDIVRGALALAYETAVQRRAGLRSSLWASPAQHTTRLRRLKGLR
jgi:pilus assembly protein CpaE